ncbi:MAG: precorrin-4 C(11)-methyltransferase [Synergistaceae bacterium]|nr:precorrin-4 C(11)-methyltransferase [Synergistaceae bacterium]
MIYFIGAGPGAKDLITVRGANILRDAGMIIYAGSLVNPELVAEYANPECELHDSSKLTLEEILVLLVHGHEENIITVRLHSGDPALYGAVREQMNYLREKNIPFEVVPGVSSLFAASAALKTEYMIPGLVQTLIISRIEGRTPAPDNASTALFLSAGMTERACSELIERGYSPDTPAVIVYHASWPDEKIIHGTLETLPELSKGITKTALILAGEFLNENINTHSRLYDKNFSHEYRK